MAECLENQLSLSDAVAVAIRQKSGPFVGIYKLDTKATGELQILSIRHMHNSPTHPQFSYEIIAVGVQFHH